MAFIERNVLSDGKCVMTLSAVKAVAEDIIRQRQVIRYSRLSKSELRARPVENSETRKLKKRWESFLLCIETILSKTRDWWDVSLKNFAQLVLYKLN